MLGRPNEKNDMAFYALMLTMGVALLAIIYARAKKFLVGRRAVSISEVIRNQQKGKSIKHAQPVVNQPKPQVVVAQLPAAETRETRAASYSPPTSPKITKKKTQRTNSLSRDEQTSAVQAKLFARQQEKQLKKDLERQQAEAAIKKRADATALFKERRAAMKLQKAEEQRQMAELLAASPVEGEAAPVPAPAFYPSITVEAKNQLKVHALFMAEFNYDTNAVLANASQHPTTQTLAFLYNFHRYNICRRLLKDKDENVFGAVELRTLLVHLANKIDLNPDMILETKAQLCSFMGEEVIRRVQNGRNTSVKDDAGLQRLIAVIGDGVNKLHFHSIQSLPLYEELYGLRDKLNAHPLAPENMTALDLYKWMVEKIIPYMNALCVEKPENVQDALKMLVIILGEYCDNSHRAAMKNIFAGIGEASRAGLMNVRDFMRECRMLRNHLAHNIFDVNINDLLALQDFACRNITGKVADVAMMEDILVPQVAALPVAAPARTGMGYID